jgi:hypothetical protein
MTLAAPGGTATLSQFDVVMIPADQDNVVFEGHGRLLETYI